MNKNLWIIQYVIVGNVNIKKHAYTKTHSEDFPEKLVVWDYVKI